jgi:hypothetical protein
MVFVSFNQIAPSRTVDASFHVYFGVGLNARRDAFAANAALSRCLEHVFENVQRSLPPINFTSGTWQWFVGPEPRSNVVGRITVERGNCDASRWRESGSVPPPPLRIYDSSSATLLCNVI